MGKETALERLCRMADITKEELDEIFEEIPERVVVQNDEKAARLTAALLIILMEMAPIPISVKFMIDAYKKSFSEESLTQLLAEEILNADEEVKKALILDVVMLTKMYAIGLLLS